MKASVDATPQATPPDIFHASHWVDGGHMVSVGLTRMFIAHRMSFSYAGIPTILSASGTLQLSLEPHHQAIMDGLTVYTQDD